MKKVTLYFAALLFFLLPLKFGGLAVMPESGGFYPENLTDCFFITWPPHALAYFGSALLVMAVIAYREKLNLKLSLFALVWSILPALAVIPGVIRGDWIIALAQWSLLLGCGSVIMAASIILNKEPEKGRLFIGALLFGSVFTAFLGWDQHLYSLDEMRKFVAEQEALGIPVSESMRLKLTDPRVFSTLASSNALASLLMIMSIIGFYMSGVWSRKITPPETAKWIMRGFFLLLFVSVLLLTRSRSALFCPVAAGVLALFSTDKIKWKWRIAGLTAGIVMLVVGAFAAAAAGRGFASMGERADYLRTSAVVTWRYPLIGSGWGGFFKNHMQMKFSDVQETARDPHNVVAAFSSQCGIPAGSIMLFVLIFPLVLLWKYRFEKSLQGTVFWCGVIFTIHSLIDCDWQVPALITVMGVLYTAALSDVHEDKKSAFPVWSAALPLALAACGTTWFYTAGDMALTRLQDKVNPSTPEMVQKYAHYSVEMLAKEAEKYRPNQANIPIFCGDWYMKTRDLRRAEDYYRKALELDPFRPAVCIRLARIALLENDEQKAEELVMQAQKLFPKSNKYSMEKLRMDLKL